ncbi:GNAT family N-acetyltransferase [Ramlibacter pallidus]|uniref:GNAT family N-acetyltransferase n=1 Tax=Ramlibacter pallidus TaxID=2780087 RepID=A0ABR9RYY9_9BURK|nr:GNAT family N-acetyltransferase [Ramlibacter pallidus]MBE7366471.1 GNAT family N-acetyltransferase [Ramlibacter pallidus]
MPHFRLHPAADVAPADLHAAFTTAFADYLIGPFRQPLELWPRFLARQGVDIGRSRVAVGDAGILAFALVAPRADVASWRLGVMGAVPAARGTGAAPALLDDFIARAKGEGQRRVELECFAQNERGLRLYRGRGFAGVAPLHGYGSEGVGPSGLASGAVPVGLDEAFAWIDGLARARGDLPLQVTSVSLRAQPMHLHAWRCNGAQVVAAGTAPDQVTVLSLLDTEPGQGGTPALIGALRQQWPEASLHVPQLQRDDLGGDALRRLGFQPLPLHQLLMHRPLA